MAFTCALVLLLILPSGAWALTKPTPTPDPGVTTVVFSGHVYYSNGVTPIGGATVTINYPIGGTPTTATTDSAGYYSVTLPLGTDTVSRSAAFDTVSTFDFTDQIKDTGTNPISSIKDMVLSVDAPTSLYGYVTTGSSHVSGIPIRIESSRGRVADITSDINGYYQFNLSPTQLGDLTVFAIYSSSPYITSPTYTVNVVSGSNVQQDLLLPTQSITYQIRVLRDGAPVPGIGVRMEYCTIGCLIASNRSGISSWTTGYFGGGRPVKVKGQQTVSGRYVDISPEYTFVPSPESAGGTYSYDLVLPPSATPTATPAATPTSSPATATPTPAPSTPTPSTPTSTPVVNTPTPAAVSARPTPLPTPTTTVTPTTSATVVGTVTVTAGPSALSSTGGPSPVSGSTTATGTQTSVPANNTSAPAPSSRVPVGVFGGAMIPIVAGIVGLVFLVVLIAVAYLALRRK